MPTIPFIRFERTPKNLQPAEKLQGRNNKGEVVSEINTSYAADGQVITTSTTYDGRGNAVSQRVTIRRNDGTVGTTTVLGGKILA